jgi:hypothetical protein
MKKGLGVMVLLAGTAGAAEPWFADGFEAGKVGALPGAPWKEEMYDSGAIIRLDDARAFAGRQSLHVITPAGARYRRGYVAIHLAKSLPQAQLAMYGRAMVWLEAAPTASPGAPPVHWTLLQGEGRSADDRYNSIASPNAPRFDSLHLGLERYADSADDQKLWMDEVAIAARRIGCPKLPAKTSRGGVE